VKPLDLKELRPHLWPTFSSALYTATRLRETVLVLSVNAFCNVSIYGVPCVNALFVARHDSNALRVILLQIDQWYHKFFEMVPYFVHLQGKKVSIC
jgi:hypothetical protein